MTTSTLELIAIAQDFAGQLQHLGPSDRLIVATTLNGLAFGEFPTEEQGAWASWACNEVLQALRRSAEQDVRP